MKYPSLILALATAFSLPVNAEITAKQNEVMKQLLATYTEKAKAEGKIRKGKDVITPEAGREFYLVRRSWQDTDFTCSGCHTEDPKKEGKHIETKKPIKPLAPAVNPERFTDVDKVESNFTKHCMDLHERDCRAYEKANFIAYLMSVK